MCPFGVNGNFNPAFYWTMMIGMFLFWAFVVFLVYRLLRRAGMMQRPEEKGRSNALKILDERFAKGDIDEKEYETRKSRLLK